MANVSSTAPNATSHGSVAAAFVFASIATAVAGFLDAVGYNQLDHLYVSFMSGNSTHFGMSLAEKSWNEAFRGGAIILTFVVGTVVGTLLLDSASRPTIAILLGEAFLCGIAVCLAFTGANVAALTLTALMMGMQNVLHQNVNGTDAGKGFITGALFGFGQSLARIFKLKGSTTKAAVYASTWLFFIAGVVLGTVCIEAYGVVTSLGLAFTSFVMLIALAIWSGISRTQNQINRG